MIQTIVILILFSMAALHGSRAYFRRYPLKRPPIGVFNLWDVALMIGGILAIPYLYLLLPTWLVATLLGVSVLGIGYTVLEPLVRSNGGRWFILVVAATLDLCCLRYFGAGSQPFLLVNNLLQVMVVVGVTNLWAQSGMKARDCAILGATLTVYDLLFTTLLPLMSNLFHHLDGLPFAPQVGWPLPDGRLFAIGVGDLLLAAVFPLVIHKAYGAKAGTIARDLMSSALGAVLLLPLLLPTLAIFPVMTIIGPLMVSQVLVYRRHIPVERTTWHYRQAEPFLRSQHQND